MTEGRFWHLFYYWQRQDSFTTRHAYPVCPSPCPTPSNLVPPGMYMARTPALQLNAKLTLKSPLKLVVRSNVIRFITLVGWSLKYLDDSTCTVSNSPACKLRFSDLELYGSGRGIQDLLPSMAGICTSLAKPDSVQRKMQMWTKPLGINKA